MIMKIILMLFLKHQNVTNRTQTAKTPGMSNIWSFFFLLNSKHQNSRQKQQHSIYPLLVKGQDSHPGLGAVIMQLGCNFLQLRVHGCQGFQLFLLKTHGIFRHEWCQHLSGGLLTQGFSS